LASVTSVMFAIGTPCTRQGFGAFTIQSEARASA
jgi:hypothetical protein